MGLEHSLVANLPSRNESLAIKIKNYAKCKNQKFLVLFNFSFFKTFCQICCLGVSAETSFGFLEKSFQVWQLSGSTICIFAFGQNLTLESL